MAPTTIPYWRQITGGVDDHESDTDELVLVTGASGFIAGHTIRLLQLQGYRVRGTVRSLANEQKVAAIHALCPHAKYPVELFEADLEQAGSFDDAVAGCKFVVHMAQPMHFNPKDPMKDVVQPALDGVRNVAASLAKAPSVQRVVFTSSVAALAEQPVSNRVYTEEDWNTTYSTKDAYYMAKTLAEREFWKLAADAHWQGVAVLPAMVWGPILNDRVPASVGMLRDLAAGKMPLAPKIGFTWTDVRDVARLHSLCMRHEAAAGERFLCGHPAGALWTLQLSEMCAKMYPQYKRRWPVRSMPNAMMYMVAATEPSMTVASAWKYGGVFLRQPTAKATRLLGYRHMIAPDVSLRDTIDSLFAAGAVPK